MPRYQSPHRTVALDLEPDGTFTVWQFDESEPYIKTWVTYEGSSSRVEDGLALQCHTRFRHFDGERDDDSTRFFVRFAEGRPVSIEAFGGIIELKPTA